MTLFLSGLSWCVAIGSLLAVSVQAIDDTTVNVGVQSSSQSTGGSFSAVAYLGTIYQHVDELAAGTFLPIDEVLSDAGISSQLRLEVESFIDSSVADQILQAARQRVAADDADCHNFHDYDVYASQVSSLNQHYGHLRSSFSTRDLDAAGRLWQYVAEEWLEYADNRSAEFKRALLLLLTENYQSTSTVASSLSCPSANNTFSCSACSPYRTADGSCNNLRKPQNGMAGAPLRRFAKSVYADGVGEPRTTAISGQPLPSARKVSTSVISRQSNLNVQFTHLLMQWAQIIDHDFTSSPMIAGADGISLACCADDVKQAMNLNDAQVAALQTALNARYGCFNIPVPPNDPYFKNRTCLGFSRSSTTIDVDCRLGQRSPVNKLTSYMDGSMVYGSTQAEQNALRSFQGGRLRTQEIKGRRSLLPTLSGQAVCNTGNITNDCFTAGDDRVNEQPGLASLHTVLLREHNRVAAALSLLNPKWTDEKKFQEARKIVAAEIQHITYSEFLPLIIGGDLYKFYKLMPESGGHYSYDYDDHVDATIRTEFSSVAYRFGHTLLRDTFTLKTTSSATMGSFQLQNQYFKPDLIYNKSISDSAIIRGLLQDPAERFDSHITTQVTDHLFETGGAANTPLDLIALNIQRAREHGIPSYVALRKVFGMSVPATFQDLVDTHDQSVIDLFHSVYENVADIDPFIGGISERSLRGSLLGPLFGKVVALQYKLAKTGDRFFYENGFDDDSSCFSSNFSPVQLAQLRKATIARLLCDNSDIPTIQPNAFLISSSATSCASLPSVNILAWKAYQ